MTEGIPLGHIIKFLHVDKGSSLRDVFAEWCMGRRCRSGIYSYGIKEQHGFADRSGGVLTSLQRKTRIESGLPENFWPELLEHAVQLLNLMPKQTLSWKTPTEVVLGRKPNLPDLALSAPRPLFLSEDSATENLKRLIDRKLASILASKAPT
jgi:hypothetical protein